MTLRTSYLEMMRAHVDEGGQLSHQNGVDLLTEVECLKAWVSDLQSGLYVNCVYCGHRYGPGETTPVSMADALKAHVVQCPQHPMSVLASAADAAWHALKSYEFGNGSPDLARDQAAFLKAALKSAGVEVKP